MANRGLNQDSQIILYSLQTCTHCKDVKQYLKALKVSFKTIYVDMLLGEERSETLRRLRRINPEASFPTLVMGDRIIIGFKKGEIDSALEGL